MKKFLAMLSLTVLLLSGCSATHNDAPEPSSSNIINGSHTQVIQMPNGFRNVAFTCYGNVGVYVTSRGCDTCTIVGSDIAVLANDPHCAS